VVIWETLSISLEQLLIDKVSQITTGADLGMLGSEGVN
jgi:hypothetical protein